MKSALKLGSFVLLSVLLSSCAILPSSRAAVVVTAQNAQSTNTISGTVTYLQSMALPDSAIVTVVLQDQTNKQAVPGAEQAMKTEGQQAPFPFELSYDLAQLTTDHIYALVATITVDGKIAYATQDPTTVDVFSDAPISGVELILQPAQGSATASQPGNDTEASPLAGTQWQLSAVVSDGAPIVPVQGTTITLNFGSNGLVDGSAGCNDYTGSYRTGEGKQIVFSDLATTRKSCPEPVMQQEQQYLDLLGTGGTYNLVGDRLTLNVNLGKTPMQFGPLGSKAATSPSTSLLAGTKWKLDAIQSSGATATVVQGVTITLDFGADGQLSGNDGCNQYSGSYSTNGENIKIGPLASTMKACDEAVMKQASTYLQILQAASQYLLESGALRLTGDGGQQALNYTGFP